MRTPKLGARRTMLAAAVPVGMVISGALVYSSSYAAFNATTDNTGNSFTAGTVQLSDNDAGQTLFTITNGTPSTTYLYRCIELNYTGSTAASVRLYATNYTPARQNATTLDPNDIGDNSSFTVETSPTGPTTTTSSMTNADCQAGTGMTLTNRFNGKLHLAAQSDLNGFGNRANFTNGVQGFSPVSGQTSQKLWYRIGYKIDDTDVTTQDAVNEGQGDTASLNLVWEAQNT